MGGRWYTSSLAVARHGWLFILLAAIQLLPPYASRGYDLKNEWLRVVPVREPIFSGATWRPLFKALPLVLIALAVFRCRGWGRLLAAYVAVNNIAFICHQAIGKTAQYGLVVDVGLLLMLIFVVAVWTWEAMAGQTDFRIRHQPWWRYWVIPVALVAFWYPLAPQTGRPDFHPSRLLMNGAGLAFCTMIPLYTAVLTLCWPRVNALTLRVTSLAGLVAGVGNMYINFVQFPARLWWNGVLHLPLLFVCAYGTVLSLRQVISPPATSTLRYTDPQTPAPDSARWS